MGGSGCPSGQGAVSTPGAPRTHLAAHSQPASCRERAKLGRSRGSRGSGRWASWSSHAFNEVSGAPGAALCASWQLRRALPFLLLWV